MATRHFILYKGFADSNCFDDIEVEAPNTTFETRSAQGLQDCFTNIKHHSNCYAILCVDANHDIMAGPMDSSFSGWCADAKEVFKNRVFILMKGNPDLRISPSWKSNMPGSFRPFYMDGKLIIWEELPDFNPLRTMCDMVTARSTQSNISGSAFGLQHFLILFFVTVIIAIVTYNLSVVKADTLKTNSTLTTLQSNLATSHTKQQAKEDELKRKETDLVDREQFLVDFSGEIVDLDTQILFLNSQMESIKKLGFPSLDDSKKQYESCLKACLDSRTLIKELKSYRADEFKQKWRQVYNQRHAHKICNPTP